jgi:hypothetical protein
MHVKILRASLQGMFGRQAVQTLLVKVQSARENLGIQHVMPQGKDSVPSKAG